MGNGDVSGVLTVKVVRGSKLVVRDLNRLSDPYVVIKLGDQEVWDKDRFTRDDFMGRGEIDLKPIVTQATNSKRSRDVNLKLQKVHSGALDLKLGWQPGQ